MIHPENLIIELAILGVCHNQPLPSHKIITITKNIMPELWYPTAEVVISAIERSITTGHLKMDVTEKSLPMIKATKIGKQQLRNLLLSDSDDSTSPSGFALEIMQMCLLDLVSADVAASVLIRIRERFQNRLSGFRQRSQKCLHIGQYTNLWFLIETHRLVSSVHILDLAYGKINCEHLTQIHI